MYVKRKAVQVTEHAVLTDDQMSGCNDNFTFLPNVIDHKHIFLRHSQETLSIVSIF